MGNFHDSIPPNLIAWIQKQHLFYVATAPLNPTGHVNVSPKGCQDTFHVIDANKVWYEDMTGSGVETISHLKENKRITLMFNAFEGPPRVVRLFGYGTVHEYGTDEYNTFIPPETRKPGSRAVIVIDVYQVGSSCGFSVPFMSFVAPRKTLMQVAKGHEKKDTLKKHWSTKNSQSLDGLTGLEVAGSTEGMLESRDVDEIVQEEIEREKVSKADKEEIGEGEEAVVSAEVRSKSLGVNNPRPHLNTLFAFSLGVLVTAICVKMTDVLH